MSYITDDDRFYHNDEEWSWDANTKTLANGLRHAMTKFGHIFSFSCAKEMLEPMWPPVSPLQACLVEVYLGFKKIDDVKNFYNGIRSELDPWFECIYEKVLKLSVLVQSNEERPCVSSRQQNRDNTPPESVSEYWKHTVAIPFLDSLFRPEKLLQPRNGSTL